jgi:hypothetical protein
MTAKWVDYGLSFLPQSTPACRAVLMICRCRSSESLAFRRLYGKPLRNSARCSPERWSPLEAYVKHSITVWHLAMMINGLHAVYLVYLSQDGARYAPVAVRHGVANRPNRDRAPSDYAVSIPITRRCPSRLIAFAIRGNLDP